MQTLTTLRNDALKQLFARATENASTAIERWTGEAISLRLDDLCEVPIEEALPRLEVEDEPRVMAMLQVEGDLKGDFILMFDERDGRRLCTELTGLEPDMNAPWSELETSALMETGNILGSAFLNLLTSTLGRALLPSPPRVMRDYGVSVLEQVLMSHAIEADTVFVSRTTFLHRKNGSLNGHVFFVPTLALREVMWATVGETQLG